MDQTGRKITKIAREVGKFTVQTMKEEGIGTAEFDFIHLVRHNPGITQTEVRENLKIDKGRRGGRQAWRQKGISRESRIRRMEEASCFTRQKRRRH